MDFAVVDFTVVDFTVVDFTAANFTVEENLMLQIAGDFPQVYLA